jgi:hypothetical protein
MPGCRLPLTVMCVRRSHASSCVSGTPLPADASGRAARRTYTDYDLEADSDVTAAFNQQWYSGGAVSTVRHPHVPTSVRAVLGGSEADAVRGRLFLPRIWTMTTKASAPLPDLGAPTCSRDLLHRTVQQWRI